MENLKQIIEKDRIVNLAVAFGWELEKDEVVNGIVYLLIKKEIKEDAKKTPPEKT
jgi:hypothetical protein